LVRSTPSPAVKKSSIAPLNEEPLLRVSKSGALFVLKVTVSPLATLLAKSRLAPLERPKFPVPPTAPATLS
jgi:hypothetical protein